MRSDAPEPEPTPGLILAAGRSRRMGTPKALIHLAGRTLLDHLVENFARAHLSPIIVVASGVTFEMAQSLPGIDLVEGDPEQPMIDSVARGLHRLGPKASRVVINPVDAPFTSPEMIAALCAGSGLVTRVMCHAGQPGHPVLLPRSLFAEVRERPDGGLRALMGRYDVELVEWLDNRPLADLDTPADLAAWESRGEGLIH